ncbi:MAG: NUDIX domain-containing protein [Thermoplasmata archaeon]
MNVILVPVTYKGYVLVYNTRKNGWEFPGGKIEEGEDAVKAVLRESSEEAGLTIENLKFVKAFKNNYVFVAKATVLKGGEFKAEIFGTLPFDLVYDRNEYLQILKEAKEKLNDNNIPSLI